MNRLLVLALVVLLVPVVGCTAAASTVPASITSASSSSTSEPSPVFSSVAATGGGLKLIAAFDRLEVAAGGTVTIALSIENTRPTDVIFEDPCAGQPMTVEVRVPAEPLGREWDGIAAAFKTYALEQSTGSPMESSIRTPLRTIATAKPCIVPPANDGGLPTTIIEAGGTYETVLTWPAELVRGVPAPPGPAPFSITVRYDHRAAGNGLTQAETLEATGTITVLDGARSAVSPSEALDAAIAEPAFAKWLAKQPERAWANANLYLEPGAIGVKVLPTVPYWAVELFREPRNWAILYVDALSGEILSRSFCNIPCDR